MHGQIKAVQNQDTSAQRTCRRVRHTVSPPTGERFTTGEWASSDSATGLLGARELDPAGHWRNLRMSFADNSIGCYIVFYPRRYGPPSLAMPRHGYARQVGGIATLRAI